MRNGMLTVLQVLGVFAVLAGLYGLVGLWWSLLAGGVMLLALATLAEALPPRPAPGTTVRRARPVRKD